MVNPQDPMEIIGRSNGETSSVPIETKSPRFPAWKRFARICVEERIFLLLILATALTRLVFLGGHDIWIDEWHTIAQRWGVLKENPIRNPSWLAFQTYRLSLSTFFNVWGLRLPSALFNIIGVGFIYFLARLWFRRQRSLTIMSLALLSPFLLYFSQEGRYYSMVFAWTTISLFFASIFILRHSIIAAVLTVLAGVALYMTHPASVGMVAGTLAWMGLMTLWDWRYWWRKAMSLHVLFRWILFICIFAFIVMAFYAVILWGPQFIAWQKLPLSKGISFQKAFFISHFTDFITSPAYSFYYDLIVKIGCFLMGIGFITLWFRQPVLNILLVLQYLFTFIFLFIARAEAPYALKYSTGLIISQLIWVGSGIFILANVIARGTPQSLRLKISGIACTVIVLGFGLLYSPDYGRILFRSINPVNGALDYIADTTKGTPDKRSVVFAVANPAIQLKNIQQFGIGAKNFKNLDPIYLDDDEVTNKAKAADLITRIRNTAYWTGTAWLLGNGVEKKEKTPLIDENLGKTLSLVDVYPSTLWPSFWAYLYQVSPSRHILLYPYPPDEPYSAQVQGNRCKLLLDCLVDGVWKLSAQGPGYRIRRIEVDGVKADRRNFTLTKGNHEISLLFAKGPQANVGNMVEIQLENALKTTRYALAFFREPLLAASDIISSDAQGRLVAQLGSGDEIKMPIVDQSEKPLESLIELNASSKGGRSFIGVMVDDEIQGVVPIDSPTSKTVYFRASLPSGGDSLRLMNITPVPKQLNEKKGDPTTETVCSLYTLTVNPRVSPEIPDANLLKMAHWISPQDKRLPFFKENEQGISLSWIHNGTPHIGISSGRTADTTAIDIALDPLDGEHHFISPPIPFGKADSVFLRTFYRNTNPNDYGFALRIFYMDKRMDMKNPVRTNYLAKPSQSGVETTWSDIIYFDDRRSGEEGFYIEIDTWGTQTNEQFAKSGHLYIEEFILDPQMPSE